MVVDRELFQADERRAVEGIDHLHLVYEEDLISPEKHQATVDRVVSWLGLESREAKTSLKKITTKPADQLIANFDECLAEYEKMRAEGIEKFRRIGKWRLEG